ncbi:MAG: hypothetical protein A2Y34_18710 [Spirochaetes bacterium GWC1_27_15]|nr:MAG: hypothetical protein A2Y34_18710 [Spirochaetes bacterium GWC1_27_15]
MEQGKSNTDIQIEEAKYKEDALKLIKTFRFDGVNGYFYVYDYEGKNIAHPIQPQLEGENLWEMKDKNGVMVIQELIKAAQNRGGFVNFVWNKPEISKEVDKIGYATGFDSWEWMVGTGLYIDDIQKTVDEFKKDVFIQRLQIIATFFIIAIIFIVIGWIVSAGIVTRLLIDPLKKLIEKSETIGKGDLTVKFEFDRKDELGELIKSFSGMVDTLKNLNQKIYIAIIILTKNLRNLFKSANAVRDSANTQAVTVEETLGNFESMNSMVETISNESGKANSYTDQALRKAQQGMDSMQKLEGEMAKIESSSQEITNIIEMINEIAEQTNLLSLNASIESARAGEAGKGFNIVAGEIRKLAEKSTGAANRIHELITNNNKIIQEGVKYSKTTTNILKEISFSNELITGLVKTISDEVHKVKLSSKEILQAINHISFIAQANLSESEKVSGTMNDFVAQTLELQKFVGQFDVRSDKIKENQQHIEEILKSKLIEAGKILQEYGASFLPTGENVPIGNYKVSELQVGKTIVTGSTEIVDSISKRTNTSVTIFQVAEDCLIRVATTVRNFDNSRAIGTIIPSENNIYKTVMDRKEYFGRAFVVNRWYVAVYKPIIDETGFIFGVIYLGIPEEMEISKDTNLSNILDEEQEGILKDTTFKHQF